MSLSNINLDILRILYIYLCLIYTGCPKKPSRIFRICQIIFFKTVFELNQLYIHVIYKRNQHSKSYSKEVTCLAIFNFRNSVGKYHPVCPKNPSKEVFMAYAVYSIYLSYISYLYIYLFIIYINLSIYHIYISIYLSYIYIYLFIISIYLSIDHIYLFIIYICLFIICIYLFIIYIYTIYLSHIPSIYYIYISIYLLYISIYLSYLSIYHIYIYLSIYHIYLSIQLDGTNCDIVKSKYLSDDTLTDQHPNATPR